VESFVSIVRHGDDPLRPEPEHRVDQDDRHDEGQPDQAGAHHVDDQRFCEHFAGVGWAEGVNSGKGCGDVEPRVQEVGDPFCVGNAVVVVVSVVVVVVQVLKCKLLKEMMKKRKTAFQKMKIKIQSCLDKVDQQQTRKFSSCAVVVVTSFVAHMQTKISSCYSSTLFR